MGYLSVYYPAANLEAKDYYKLQRCAAHQVPAGNFRYKGRYRRPNRPAKRGCIFFNFFKYKVLVLNMLVYRTTMKSNFKLAPVSCHCKLNELIPHLKNMSVQQASDSAKGTVIVHPATAEYLMKRYI